MVINLIVGFKTYIISYYKDSLLKLGRQPQYKKLIDPGIFRGSLSFEKQLLREPWSSILIQNHLVNHQFFYFFGRPWIHFTCTIFRQTTHSCSWKMDSNEHISLGKTWWLSPRHVSEFTGGVFQRLMKSICLQVWRPFLDEAHCWAFISRPLFDVSKLTSWSLKKKRWQ